MTKVKEIIEIDSSTNTFEWVAEILRRRFAEVLALRDDAFNTENIEGVHQMRVATRRLRSVLRDFSSLIDLHHLKKPKKELKRLADSLGNVRDQDVAITALEKLREKAKRQNIKNGIEKMIVKRQEIRENKQNSLMEILADSLIENLRDDFSKAIDDLVQKNEKTFNLVPKEAGREIIAKSLQEFCDLSESLYNPFNSEDLHKLRIAAKRLRYAIELFTFCWSEQITPFAKEITEMQTFLGELHDCDVWIENLRKRLSKAQDGKHQADFWLLSRFTKKRTKNYRAALRLWSKWRKNNFIKRLKAVLQTNQ